MPADSNRIDIHTFRRFSAMENLSDKQLILLAAGHELLTYKKKEVITEIGNTDNLDYFLVDGSVELIAKDGRKQTIAHDSPTARNPVAHLRPRHYTVRAVSAVKMLVIEWDTLQSLGGERSRSNFVEDADSLNSTTVVDLIRENFSRDLESNEFDLPSLPDIALKVRDALESPSCDATYIAKILNTDPSMAVKIISAAKSPIFHAASEIKSCDQAVVRLGTDTVKQLVQIYAMKELFNTKREKLKKEFQILWNRTTQVSSIAFVLAKLVAKDLDPQKAILAGFVHDIGVLPVLTYIDQNADIIDARDVSTLINELKTDLAERMLLKWGWTDEFLNVVKHADEWLYHSNSEKMDYIDVIHLAKIHWGIGKKVDYPPIYELTAYAKIDEGELTPEKSLQILSEAQKEISAAHKLFSI
jgi:HD-like signal output (HDOD) protein